MLLLIDALLKVFLVESKRTISIGSFRSVFVNHFKSVVDVLSSIKYFALIIILPSLPIVVLSLYYSVYLVDVLGLSLVTVGFYTTIYSGSRLLFTLIAGFIVDRIGERNSLLISFTMEFMFAALFLLIAPFNAYLALAIYVFTRFASPLYVTSYTTYTAKMIPKEKLHQFTVVLVV